MKFLVLFLMALIGSNMAFAMEDTPMLTLVEAARAGDVDALKTLRNEAERGNINAQYTLGKGYPFIHVSCDEAKQWLQKAGSQGYAMAQRKLAGLYMNGCGLTIPADYKSAYYWELLVKKTHEEYPDLPGRLKSDEVNDDYAIPEWISEDEKHLTPEDISEVKKQVAAWKPSLQKLK